MRFSRARIHEPLELADVYQPIYGLGGGYIYLEGQYFGVRKQRETLIETWVHEFTEWCLHKIIPKLQRYFKTKHGTTKLILDVKWSISFNGVTRKTNIPHLLASLIAGSGYRKKDGSTIDVSAEEFDPKTQSRLPRWTK